MFRFRNNVVCYFETGSPVTFIRSPHNAFVQIGEWIPCLVWLDADMMILCVSTWKEHIGALLIAWPYFAHEQLYVSSCWDTLEALIPLAVLCLSDSLNDIHNNDSANALQLLLVQKQNWPCHLFKSRLPAISLSKALVSLSIFNLSHFSPLRQLTTVCSVAAFFACFILCRCNTSSTEWFSLPHTWIYDSFSW